MQSTIIPIRPITLRTRDILTDLGLLQALDNPSADQTAIIMGIAWVHTRPIAEVQALIAESKAVAHAAIQDFIADTPLEDVFAYIAPIRDQLQRIQAAAVAVMPKPTDTTEDGTPKNS